MSNVLHFPQPTEAVHINDETMSLLTNEQLAYRVWCLLDSTVELVGSPDSPDASEWIFNHSEAYSSALEGLICARVLARRLIGAEPREIHDEQIRRLRVEYGIEVMP